MEKLIKKHADKLRFGLVGVINTAIDFGVLTLLVSFGFNSILGNYMSTSVALCFSFFANKSYTFKDTGNNSAKKVVRFLIVTLIGLWVLQPIVISLASSALQSSHLNSYVILWIGKIIATVVSLVWNYVLYKKVVYI